MANKQVAHVTQNQRVKPHLTARNWNAFADAANAHQRKRGAGEGANARAQFSGADPPGVAIAVSQDGEFLKNWIGGIGAYGLDPETIANRTKWPFEVAAPVAADHGSFVVLRDHLASDNSYNDATINGLAFVRLFVETAGAWITRADVDITTRGRLKTHPGGSAQILWKSAPTENAEVDALVRLSNNENVTYMGTAQGTIVAGAGGDMLVKGATTYTLPVVLDWMHQGQNISDGKEIGAMWFPDERVWRVLWAECEDEPGTTFGQMGSTTLDTDNLTATPTMVSAYDPALTLVSPGAIANEAAGWVQIPDTTGSEVLKIEFSASAEVAAGNNNAMILSLGVNGTSVENLLGATFRQAGQSQGVSFSRYYVPGAASSPQISVMAESTTGPFDLNWLGKNLVVTVQKA